MAFFEIQPQNFIFLLAILMCIIIKLNIAYDRQVKLQNTVDVPHKPTFSNHRSMAVKGYIPFSRGEEGEFKFSWERGRIISARTHTKISYIIWVETTVPKRRQIHL